MRSEKSTVERSKFSERLLSSLTRLGYKPKVTELTIIFNSLSGEAPITTHGFRKWVIGESLPTQSRLCVLAEWLQITPEWLRYGGAEPPLPELNLKSVEVPRDIHLMLRDYKLLSEDSKKIFDNTLTSILAIQANRPNTIAQ